MSAPRAPWGLDHPQGRQPNAFFGLTEGWWLFFTSSGTCINALLLNMSGFALFLFSLIRADNSCSLASTINGSRASLAPPWGNKILSCGCCACQASWIQLSSPFKTLYELWLHSVGLIGKMKQLQVYVPHNPWHLPLLLVPLWKQWEHIRKSRWEKAHFPPGNSESWKYLARS